MSAPRVHLPARPFWNGRATLEYEKIPVSFGRSARIQRGFMPARLAHAARLPSRTARGWKALSLPMRYKISSCTGLFREGYRPKYPMSHRPASHAPISRACSQFRFFCAVFCFQYWQPLACGTPFAPATQAVWCDGTGPDLGLHSGDFRLRASDWLGRSANLDDVNARIRMHCSGHVP